MKSGQEGEEGHRHAPASALSEPPSTPLDHFTRSEDRYDRLMRQIAQTAVLLGAFVFGLVFVSQAIHTMLTQNWIMDVAQKHFAATICLPFAALAALCLVVILQISAGRIELSGFGVSFRGAAAPIIMWIFCFLTIATAVKAVWALG